MRTHVWYLALLFAAFNPAGSTLEGAVAAPPGPHSVSGPADFGPNVLIFDPGMSTSLIQAAIAPIASQQVPNQFGSQRYALLFKPGTYGSKAEPLTFQVGYYTSVAGLGRSPGDVIINGAINVTNQCFGAGNCIALDNFWRSLANLHQLSVAPLAKQREACR